MTSLKRTVDVLGDRWTLLLLDEVLQGTHRFVRLRTNLGIASNLLTVRLQRLVDEGLVARVEYQTRPLRWEYIPTEKGNAVLPILASMKGWDEAWGPRAARQDRDQVAAGRRRERGARRVDR